MPNYELSENCTKVIETGFLQNTLLKYVKIPTNRRIWLALSNPGFDKELFNLEYESVFETSPEYRNTRHNAVSESLDCLDEHFWQQHNYAGRQFDVVIANAVRSPQWARACVLGSLMLNPVPTVCVLQQLVALDPNSSQRTLYEKAMPYKLILVHPRPTYGSRQRNQVPICWAIYWPKNMKPDATEIVIADDWRTAKRLG